MKQSLIFFLSFFFVVPVLYAPPKVEVEFPNYFAEFKSEAEAKKEIEEVLYHILDRLDIRYVLPGGDELKKVGFINELRSQALALDPDMQLYVAGGVVRSLLGYVYNVVYDMKHKDPDLDIHMIFKLMKKEEEPVLRQDALGIGSDFDMLFLFRKEKSDLSKIKSKLTNFINSAETHMGLRDVDLPFKKSFVLVGDVKSYKTQIDRATAQGGSALDWLAFSISEDTGSIKEPDGDLKIFTNFFHGTYDYLPPKLGEKEEDADKQTIRGLRALLELPFLDISKEGTEQISKELNRLITSLQLGGRLSPKAMEQLDKMMRNARFQGGHNRIFRSKGQVEQLVSSLASVLAERKKGSKLPPVYEFLRNVRPEKRQPSYDPCSLKERGLLMDQQTFIDTYTDKGALYHGTPDVKNILSMMRGGLVPSDGKSEEKEEEKTIKQGVSYCGAGFYTSGNKGLCSTYGIPITLTVREVPLRILNWVKYEAEERKLKKPYIEENFLQLSEKCDLDIIVNTYPLIQNSGAVTLPRSLETFISLQAQPLVEPISARSVKEFFALKPLWRLLPSEKRKEIDAIVEENYKKIIYGLKPLSQGFTNEEAIELFEYFDAISEKMEEKSSYIAKVMNESFDQISKAVKPIHEPLTIESLREFFQFEQAAIQRLPSDKRKETDSIVVANFDKIIKNIRLLSEYLERDSHGRLPIVYLLDKYNFPVSVLRANESLIFSSGWIEVEANSQGKDLDEYRNELHCSWHINEEEFQRKMLTKHFNLCTQGFLLSLDISFSAEFKKHFFSYAVSEPDIDFMFAVKLFATKKIDLADGFKYDLNFVSDLSKATDKFFSSKYLPSNNTLNYYWERLIDDDNLYKLIASLPPEKIEKIIRHRLEKNVKIPDKLVKTLMLELIKTEEGERILLSLMEYKIGKKIEYEPLSEGEFFVKKEIFTLLFPRVVDPKKQVKLVNSLYLNDSSVSASWSARFLSLNPLVQREIFFVEETKRGEDLSLVEFLNHKQINELLDLIKSEYHIMVVQWNMSDMPRTPEPKFRDRAFLQEMIPDQLPH